MCLTTKDKKKKTGIKFGWKLFKRSHIEGELLPPFQSFSVSFSFGETKDEPSPELVLTRHSYSGYIKEFTYHRGFHFFIDRRQAVKLFLTRYSHRGWVLVKCAVAKVHTTGTQSYGEYKNGQQRFLAVGVCHRITPLQISRAKGTLRCQK
jgi:hypothetical protein